MYHKEYALTFCILLRPSSPGVIICFLSNSKFFSNLRVMVKHNLTCVEVTSDKKKKKQEKLKHYISLLNVSSVHYLNQGSFFFVS